MSKANVIQIQDLPERFSDEFLELYALMCRTISKPIRLKILQLIGNSKMNVTEIQKNLNISLPSLSNHLNDLYRAGILKKEKSGNFVFYYLTQPELLSSIKQMMHTIVRIMGQRDTSKL
jgi:ArsR family transcriptional regulator